MRKFLKINPTQATVGTNEMPPAMDSGDAKIEETIADALRQASQEVNETGSDNTDSAEVEPLVIPGGNTPEGTQNGLPPGIPDEIYDMLPDTIRQGSTAFKYHWERDVFLNSTIAVLSGIFPTVSGIYAQERIFPNVFLYILAFAGSGKGAMKCAKRLIDPIDAEMKAETAAAVKAYEAELKEYESRKRKSPNDTTMHAPERPPSRMLIFPGDVTSAAFKWLLEDNDGKGIIIESEADALIDAINNNYGKFSHILRSAFQHESISDARKTGYVVQNIQFPQLTMCLSATPNSIGKFISSAENGLMSRFIFHWFEAPVEWKDVSPKGGVDFDHHFKDLAACIHRYWHKMKQQAYTFALTEQQWEVLNSIWAKKLIKYSIKESVHFQASIKRLGLISFRIAAVLSIIRYCDENKTGSTITCNDTDFQVAMSLTDIYLQHAAYVIRLLPEKDLRKLRIAKFHDALPAKGTEFSRQQAVKIGAGLSLTSSTVDEYLAKLVPDHLEKTLKYGHYQKK